LALAVLASAPAHAAGTTSSAKAITLRPLSILNLRDLDFAINVAGTTAGTVVIDPTTDARTVTGGVVAAGGTPQAAQFYTYGGPLQTLQVFRGPLPVLNRAGGGATMNVTGLTLNGPTTRFLNAAGLLDLRVGGTLAVGANQMSGSYSGTFDIIVNYF
jgi:Domain of unknown function (DUF4402)